jgi:hypothetical protein
MSIALMMKATAMPMPSRNGSRPRMKKCRALVNNVFRKMLHKLGLDKTDL